MIDPLTTALIAKPAAKLVARLLQPIYKGLESELSVQSQLAIHRFFGCYTEYLDNAFETHSHFSSVVFKNEQRRLADFYIPLTLVRTRDQQELRIDNFPTEEISEVRRLLVVDTAGMGKTTLLKYLFLNCVTQEAGVPIFVELRKLSKKKKIVDFILEQLSDVAGKHKPELFFKLLASGEFIFFLDGYDEIPEAERLAVTASIQQFIEKTPRNKFIISSRDEMGLVAFSQFQRYTIKPLKKEEAYELLRKYASSALTDLLIAKLELPENSAIHEFLTSPLLTSLLFKSFEYKQTIPLKRHIFYRQVYEALYESHDLTKEGGEFQRDKKSGLDIDRLELVLRSLGALTYKASQTEYTSEEILAFLNDAKKLAFESKASVSSILHDLTHAVPLLVVDGNYIRWSHRSIQEYFAAQYICKNTKGRQAEILTKYFEGPDASKHTNLIFLCADIDKSAFDQSIGSKIVKDLLTEFESSYNNVDRSIPEEDVLRRKSLTVGSFLFVIRTKLPPQSPTTQAAQNEYESYFHAHVRECFKRMDELCPGSYTGGMVQNADPGIGIVWKNDAQFILTAQDRLHMPIFQTEPNREPAEQDYIDKTIEFMKVDDDPHSPLNRPGNFSYVNWLIESATTRRFDVAAAKMYLACVADEAKQKGDVEPW